MPRRPIIPGTIAADTLAGELTDVVNQVREDFKARDNLYRYIDAILFRQIPVQIPDAYKKTALAVHSPLASHIANTVTAALSINPPSVQFVPIGFGPSAQANATEREHFFDASWRRQEEEGKRRLFRTFMYSLVTRGEAILKTVERSKSAWSSYTTYQTTLKGELAGPQADGSTLDQATRDDLYHRKTEEYKRGQPYPIRTTYVPPDTFYYVKGEDGFSLCAEVKQVPYYDTLARFGHALDARGQVVPEAIGLPSSEWSHAMGTKGQTLGLVEVWRWDRVDYILIGPGQASGTAGSALGRGTVVKTIRHGYGDAATKTLRGPYFHAFGISTDSVLPDRAGLGVLFPFLDLFPLLDQLLTIRSNAAFFTGFPAFKRKAPLGATLPPAAYGKDGSETDGARTRIIPGNIYPDDVEPIQQPGAGPEFNALLAELRSMLELALPSVVQGAVSGDQSGYALNQAAHLARLNWDPIVGNAEVALAERTSFESWLIENEIKETVYVWGEAPPDQKRRGVKGGWLGLGPADTGGCHAYKIVLNPETPSNRIIEVRTHAELLKLRLESPEEAITELGGNPDEVERAWLLYDMKQDPEIKQALKDRVWASLGTLDRKALGGPEVVQAALGMGGAPAPGGPPGGLPNVFQPGQNGVPLLPTPQGSVTGMGPGALAGAPPGQQGPPQNAEPLPGPGPRG